METKLWAQEIAEKIKKRKRLVAERSRHKVPYTTVDGVFNI